MGGREEEGEGRRRERRRRRREEGILNNFTVAFLACKVQQGLAIQVLVLGFIFFLHFAFLIDTCLFFTFFFYPSFQSPKVPLPCSDVGLHVCHLHPRLSREPHETHSREFCGGPLTAHITKSARTTFPYHIVYGVYNNIKIITQYYRN